MDVQGKARIVGGRLQMDVLVRPETPYEHEALKALAGNPGAETVSYEMRDSLGMHVAIAPGPLEETEAKDLDAAPSNADDGKCVDIDADGEAPDPATEEQPKEE